MADSRSPKRRGRPRGGSSTKVTPARLLALELTRERREREAYLRELVDSHRDSSGLPPEEFAFAQVLAFGVTMCEGSLDFFIDRNLNSPSDVRPKVRDALRISAYEMLFLKKPAHVVVDQGVELVRAVARKAAGLGNAVLRKMSRDAVGFPWGDPAGDIDALARLYGVPSWLAGALCREYGRPGASRMLAACLEPAPTYLVENPYLPGQEFASDLSAQAVAGLVPLVEGGAVLEVGAGRGTKTMLLQARALDELGHATRIHTVDLHAFKREILEKRLAQGRVPGVTAHVGDGRRLDEIEGLPASFETVFVDAPCSGTGTLRRHPEIRWRMGPGDVEDLAGLQLQLLEGAAPRVKPGGTLVYATCSVLSRENRENVENFLKTDIGASFEPVPVGELPRGLPQIPRKQQDVPFFQSVPTSGGPDGHFAAVLRKRE